MRRRRRSGPGVSLFAFQDIITAVAGIFILITLILCLQLQLKKHSKAKDRPAVDSRLQADVIEAEARALALQAEYDTQVQMQAEISELNRFNQADKLREMAVELDSAKQVLASMQSQVESLAEEVGRKEQQNASLVSSVKALDPTKKEISDLKIQLADFSAKNNQIKQNQGVLYRDRVDSNHSVCLVQIDGASFKVKDAATKSVSLFDSYNDFEDWLDKKNLSNRHFLIFFEPEAVDEFERVGEAFRTRSATFGFDLVEKGHEVSLTFEWELTP